MAIRLVSPKIALFDLDGSLADYDRAMLRELKLLQGPAEPPLGEDLWAYDQSSWFQARKQLVQAKAGWWRALGRLENGFQIVKLASEIGFQINVLTKGPKLQTAAWTEKLEWCAQQPELAQVPVHITMDKSLVFGRVLYDDYPAYMDAWLGNRPRGLGIMPATSTNRNYHHPNVVLWDGTNVDEVRSALRIAFAREDNEPLVLGASSSKITK